MALGLQHWFLQLYVDFVGFYLSDPVQSFVLAYWSPLHLVLVLIAVLIFFVGVYSNDAETRLEVDRAASQSRRIHRVPIPHDGPTNKADCLNGIVGGVFAFEAEHGTTFDIIVNHDAEDVVHTYGLKVMNYY